MYQLTGTRDEGCCSYGDEEAHGGCISSPGRRMKDVVAMGMRRLIGDVVAHGDELAQVRCVANGTGVAQG